MKPILNSMTKARIQALSVLLMEHRKRHGTRCHPTSEIWELAVDLCKQAPLSCVARGIGVTPNSLRKHKNKIRPPAKKRTQPRPPQFLEVRGLGAAVPIPVPQQPRPMLLQATQGSRQVELVRDDGSCLRIADPGAHGVDLRTLIHGFLAVPSASAPLPVTGGLR